MVALVMLLALSGCWHWAHHGGHGQNSSGGYDHHGDYDGHQQGDGHDRDRGDSHYNGQR